ncbi:exodeoxyribonuclease III [Propioniciclava tarda]|uniref:Exodeoxyribonuclease III n=1 Tax=Propioniciclava tarda TaxID=433330 RepID=A0A4Q9KIU3_PROTD|nr:exodeoxyribonuclease III [Propioniciclava tarda]SMO72270.1 exodeoxyribonuclease-3 [Propioniciclava tarda]
MLRIATHNVNGIRSAVRRGFGDWLAARDCDVVALQEVRCPAELIPAEAVAGYHLSYHAGVLAGRNGVALLTRTPPSAVRIGFGHRPTDEHGRYLEIDLDAPGHVPLTLGSLYLPKGATHDGPDADPAKYARKVAFMRSFRAYLTRARREAGRRGREFAVMGDFNIAHAELDLKNWRTSKRMEGFLSHEREWFGSLLGPRTLIDVVRHVVPGEQGPYSWWSWLDGRFDADVGWRIDYQLATPGLARSAVAAGTDRESHSSLRLSDHAPVVVDYDC